MELSIHRIRLSLISARRRRLARVREACRSLRMSLSNASEARRYASMSESGESFEFTRIRRRRSLREGRHAWSAAPAGDQLREDPLRSAGKALNQTARTAIRRVYAQMMPLTHRHPAGASQASSFRTWL